MLPSSTATSGVWFAGSLAVLLYAWFSMLSGGLMLLEVNTHYPHGASFDTFHERFARPRLEYGQRALRWRCFVC